MIEKINETTYRAKLVEDEIEIGDIKAEYFKPHLKLKRWGEECWMSICLATEKKFESIVENNKLKWKDKKQEIHFYQFEFPEPYKKKWTELGGIEADVILKEKPDSNKIVFNIETQGLKFYYQPKLTQEEKDKGCLRPPDIIGSYAVYHDTQDKFLKTKAEADKYQTGKAFHIFRPRMKDGAGNECWGELNIDEKKGTLTITIPQEFLDKAVYPVCHAAGLTFGYTTNGGTALAVTADYIYGSVFTTPAGSSINIDDIQAYCQFGATTNYYRYAIYLHSDSSQVANSLTPSTQASAATQWWTLAYSPRPTLSASTAYVLVVGIDFIDKGTQNLYYDTGDTDQGHYQTITYPTFPDPASFTHNNNKYSICCTYGVEAYGYVV